MLLFSLIIISVLFSQQREAQNDELHREHTLGRRLARVAAFCVTGGSNGCAQEQESIIS